MVVVVVKSHIGLLLLCHVKRQCGLICPLAMLRGNVALYVLCHVKRQCCLVSPLPC